MKTSQPDRRTLLSGLGVAAAAVALGAAPARAQSRATFAPARHTQDEWFDQVPGKHRVFIDSVSSDGISDALLFASNFFAASKSGYSLEDADVAMIVCMRHFSTPFAFNNAMWAKYGKPMADMAKYTNPRSTDAPAANPHVPRSGSGGFTGLAAKGTQFAICDMATHFLAGQIATATGGKADDIYQEMIANTVPNGRFVAAGVIGATRAQEYGYALIVAG
jgi:hypothetical protein